MLRFFTLLVKDVPRSGGGLQSVPEIGQPHEPNRMFDIFFPADAKRDPSGVGDPAVLLGKPIPQGAHRQWERKRYIDKAAFVHGSRFCASKAEFLAATAPPVELAA